MTARSRFSGAIGTIERLPIRDVWRHEAHHFTTWLVENLDVLSDALDLDLTNGNREQAAGDFSVDIVAENAAGERVIIENQYGRSDHDHLGKLLTYLSAFEAETAIWIVEEPRPEHVRAVSWLNEASSGAFYLVKAEAIRIADSPPALLLTEITGPSDEARIVGRIKRELEGDQAARHRFWVQLLERMNEHSNLFKPITPGWGGFQNVVTKNGLGYGFVANQKDVRVELYIDLGKGRENRQERNEAIFDQLHAHKDEIEEAFGNSLDWERLDGKMACRIAKRFDRGGIQDEDQWPKIIAEAVDAMVGFERALQPHIEKLRV